MSITRLAPLVRLPGILGILTLVGAGCVAAGRAVLPPATAPAGPPNIILILTDDQDVPSAAHMPRLQAQLVQQGLTFTNAFVTYPLCCPARASILTGQYPHNHQNLYLFPPLGGFKKFYTEGREASTIATWLQAGGYRTGLFGKYLNGYPGDVQRYVPPGWSAWFAMVDSLTARRYFNYRHVENGRQVFHGDQPEDYETDVLANKVISFIERAVEDDAQPFFVYFAPYAPHSDRADNGPAVPAPRHLRAFADLSLPKSPSFNEADMGDKPRAMRQLPHLAGDDYLDHLYRSRLRSLLAVDEAIERIVDTLAARDELANTYLFFTSDNGYHIGEHRLPGGKNTPFEEDIRVPLVVRGPGVPAGATLPHFVLNIDLAPTFAELAGVPAAEFVDGRSAAPLLGPAPPPPDTWRQDFFLEMYDRPERQEDPKPVRALRTQDLTYIEYPTGEFGLYDLRNDPHQLESLHAIASPEQLARLAARLAELGSCAAETCRR